MFPAEQEQKNGLTESTKTEDAEDAGPGGKPPAPGGRPRHGLWVGLALVAAACVAVPAVRRLTRAPQPAAQAVRTAKVRAGSLERTLRLTGATRAEKSVYLRTPILRGNRSRGGGDFRLELEQIAASGSQVSKGDVVGVFDPVYMVNRLDDRNAERDQLAAEIRKLESQLGVELSAHRQRIRAAKGKMDQAALDLKTAPVRSAIEAGRMRLDYEEARTAWRALRDQSRYREASLRGRIRRAELELEMADITARRARTNLDRMRGRAPMDGIVVVQSIFSGGEYRMIQAGEDLRPGQSYAQIVDPRGMLVETRANQADVWQLRIGAAATVRVDAVPGLELPARVVSIGSMALGGRSRAAYVREVPVLLRIEGSDARVLPGLSASADVVLNRQPDALVVPRYAVFRDRKDGRPFAVVRRGDVWERRDVELGLANQMSVAVVAGLREGEVVATEELLAVE